MRNHNAEIAERMLGGVRSGPEGEEAEALVRAVLAVREELAGIRAIMEAERIPRYEPPAPEMPF